MRIRISRIFTACFLFSSFIYANHLIANTQDKIPLYPLFIIKRAFCPESQQASSAAVSVVRPCGTLQRKKDPFPSKLLPESLIDDAFACMIFIAHAAKEFCDSEKKVARECNNMTWARTTSIIILSLRDNMRA